MFLGHSLYSWRTHESPGVAQPEGLGGGELEEGRRGMSRLGPIKPKLMLPPPSHPSLPPSPPMLRIGIAITHY